MGRALRVGQRGQADTAQGWHRSAHREGLRAGNAVGNPTGLLGGGRCRLGGRRAAARGWRRRGRWPSGGGGRICAGCGPGALNPTARLPALSLFAIRRAKQRCGHVLGNRRPLSGCKWLATFGKQNPHPTGWRLQAPPLRMKACAPRRRAGEAQGQAPFTSLRTKPSVEGRSWGVNLVVEVILAPLAQPPSFVLFLSLGAL
jgi:hypothetical protein